MDAIQAARVFTALEHFRIKLPSWGFANTGTRFGKFVQPAAAGTIEEKFSDAGQVQLVTGICPTVALHVLWDFPGRVDEGGGLDATSQVAALSSRFGVGPGS